MRPSEDGVESNGKQTAGPYERNSIRPLTMASLLGAGEAGTERTEARVIPEGDHPPFPFLKQRSRNGRKPRNKEDPERCTSMRKRFRDGQGWLETERQEVQET